MTTADEIRADVAAINMLVIAARAYRDARRAAPIGDWEGRIEEAGWALVQAFNSYEKHYMNNPVTTD